MECREQLSEDLYQKFDNNVEKETFGNFHVTDNDQRSFVININEYDDDSVHSKMNGVYKKISKKFATWYSWVLHNKLSFVLYLLLVLISLSYLAYSYYFHWIPSHVAPSLKTYSQEMKDFQPLPITMFCSRVQDVAPKLINCVYVQKVGEALNSINCLPENTDVKNLYSWTYSNITFAAGPYSNSFSIGCWVLKSDIFGSVTYGNFGHLDIAFAPLDANRNETTVSNHWSFPPGMFVYFHQDSSFDIDENFAKLVTASGIFVWDAKLSQSLVCKISRNRHIYLNSSTSDTIDVQTNIADINPNYRVTRNNQIFIAASYTLFQIFWQSDQINYSVEYYDYTWLDLATGLFAIISLRSVIPLVESLIKSCKS